MFGSKEGTLQLPPQASTVAAGIDETYYFIYWVCVFFFVAITGLIVLFCWKYRRRPGGPKVKQITHNTALEIGWSVGPAFLLLVMFVVGFRAFLSTFVPPAGAMEIHVTGKRWLWDFEYPQGFVRTGELHVPVHTPVKLIMQSTDVLHSLFVPAFRVKMDVVPGRYTTMWFEADSVGEYQIYCTEYCGDGHSAMWGKVIVHEEAEYAKWADDAANWTKGLSLTEIGEKLYAMKACVTCHSTDGSPKTGPSFKGLFGKQEQLADGSSVSVDENYIRESITDPATKVVNGFAPVMPTFKGQLSERELNGLVEWIKTLK